MKIVLIVSIILLLVGAGWCQDFHYDEPPLTPNEKNLETTWFNQLVYDTERREWETDQHQAIEDLEADQDTYIWGDYERED